MCRDWCRDWCCGCDCWRRLAQCGEDGEGACQVLCSPCRLACRNACALCCCCCPVLCGAPASRAQRESAAALHEAGLSRRRHDAACLGCVELLGCGWRPLQAAVAESVGPRGRFLRGRAVGPSGERGTPWDDSAAFVVEDGPLLSGRWSGDAFLLGRRFLKLVEAASEA